MSALVRDARISGWYAMALVLWVLFVALPVFVGQHCGVGFGFLTAGAVSLAAYLACLAAFASARS